MGGAAPQPDGSEYVISNTLVVLWFLQRLVGLTFTTIMSLWLFRISQRGSVSRRRKVWDSETLLNASLSRKDLEESSKGKRNCISVVAGAGLANLLDVALYRSAENGSLSSVVCAADDLLECVVDLKHLSLGLQRRLQLAKRQVQARSIATSENTATKKSSSRSVSTTKSGSGGGGKKRTATDGRNSASSSSTTTTTKGGATKSSSRSSTSSGDEIGKTIQFLDCGLSFAALCVDAAQEAILRIVLEPLGQTANVPPLPPPVLARGPPPATTSAAAAEQAASLPPPLPLGSPKGDERRREQQARSSSSMPLLGTSRPAYHYYSTNLLSADDKNKQSEVSAALASSSQSGGRRGSHHSTSRRSSSLLNSSSASAISNSRWSIMASSAAAQSSSADAMYVSPNNYYTSVSHFDNGNETSSSNSNSDELLDVPLQSPKAMRDTPEDVAQGVKESIQRREGASLLFLSEVWNVPSAPMAMDELDDVLRRTSASSSSSSYKQQESTKTVSCPPFQRRDCWESTRLCCPDYVWLDSLIASCYKLIQLLTQRHRFVAEAANFLPQGENSSLLSSILTDLSDASLSTLRRQHKKMERDRLRSRKAGLTKRSTVSRRKQSSSGGLYQLLGDIFGGVTRWLSYFVFGSYPYEHDDSNYGQGGVCCSIVDLAESIWTLLQVDMPRRLHRLRVATETNALVDTSLRRLYLSKVEYRAPIRAYLEWHEYMLQQQRASNANDSVLPDLDLIREYLHLRKSQTETVGNNRHQDYDNDDGNGTAVEDDADGTPRLETGENGNNAAIVQKVEAAESRLARTLQNPVWQEAIALERVSTEMEVDMAQQLLPFVKLARNILAAAIATVGKNASLSGEILQMPMHGNKGRLPLAASDLMPTEELLKQMSVLLCRESSWHDDPRVLAANTWSSTSSASASLSNWWWCSSGIRPLLLFLQHGEPGVGPSSHQETSEEKLSDATLEVRLQTFLSRIEKLAQCCKLEGGGYFPRVADESRNGKSGNGSKSGSKKSLSSSSSGSANASADLLTLELFQECSHFDSELFQARFEDWHDLVHRQHELASKAQKDSDNGADYPASLEEMAEAIQATSVEIGVVSKASVQELEAMLARWAPLEAERRKRYHAMREVVERLAAREMNLHLTLFPVPLGARLELPEMSAASGLFGPGLAAVGPLGL